nr:hypothetical protein [Gammaproteobacteria bacterium]
WIALAVALAAVPASARVYQWVDPDSGNVYLSGSPPAWYRSGARGPRVQVFERGKLVDDTGREASEQEANALREEALLQEQIRKEEAAAAQPPGGAAETAEGASEAPVDASAEARTQAEAAFANYLKTLVSDYFKAAAPGAPAEPPIR